MAKPTNTLNLPIKTAVAGPVECLGQNFESDQARRAHFTALLRAKLKDPEFRKTPGFPKGEDEDILAMSDPPYYTACPNPFLVEFVTQWKGATNVADEYDRKPFQADISEGKTDAIYTAHSYHTKIPHRAIMRYILHFTKPGDVVLDAFCGSGQTGVAAQACAKPDAETKARIEHDMPGVAWGARRCVLSDLAPAATFIAQNYNHPPSPTRFADHFRPLLARIERISAESYDSDGLRFNYGIWTDCFLCPFCSTEFSFWDAAVEEAEGSVDAEFPCPSCSASLKKSNLERVIERFHDPSLNRVVARGKYEMSMVNAGTGKSRALRKPTLGELAAASAEAPISDWHPATPMMFHDGPWGDMHRAGYHTGVTHVHHFFTRRNLRVLAQAWREISTLPVDLRASGRFVFTGTVQIASRMSQFRFDSRNPQNTAGGIMKGVLFVPSMSKEGRVTDLMTRRLESILRQQELEQGWTAPERVPIGTNSASATGMPAESVDYVFVDPPFGKNIIYSELSFLWEAWLRVYTNNSQEAIVSGFQEKGLPEYQQLMQACFEECFRVLRPGRWMTVVFSNSQSSVWRAIQEALGVAGFVVADIRNLDKRQRSFKQVTSSAVKQDLVISAYKPNQALVAPFALRDSAPEDTWAFVREHLRRVPVFAEIEGDLEVVLERTAQTLHDRMIAFFVQRSLVVPASGPEFFEGLDQRFARRDGMYFLSEQISAYDRKRALGGNMRQLSLFVYDEATAIRWIRQIIDDKPQSFADLNGQFLKVVAAGWAGHEKQVELRSLLDENFLHYDGEGPVPNPVHSYLSSNLKLRNLDKANPELRSAGRDRWYVPSVHSQADIDRLRLRGLLREFEEYKASTQRKIKKFRTEAVRAGFKAAYDARDWRTIVEVAAKLPDVVVQEDEKLAMYVDVAQTRFESAEQPKLF